MWENVPKSMRTELWMSVLHRRGLGMSAAEKYEGLLEQVRKNEGINVYVVLAMQGACVCTMVQQDLRRALPVVCGFQYDQECCCFFLQYWSLHKQLVLQCSTCVH